MKKSILFLPASIRSHVIPALYLANLLAKEYDIHFAVTSGVLQEIVTKQGYNAIPTSFYRVALAMEAPFLQGNKRKVSWWAILRSIQKNEVYKYRQNELSEIVDRISPTTIFIDIFNSSDILVLYPKYKEINLIFLNPMLSTYRVNGFPTVSEWQWPTPLVSEKVSEAKRRIPLKYLLIHPFNAIMTKARDMQFEKSISIDGFNQRHPLAKDGTNALLFDNIPEIILAPIELELSPQIRKLNQHYLGLCISENREDNELDVSFDERFEAILEQKKSRKRLIYCSFGTFYEGSDKALLDFLNRLLDAIEGLENVEAILSVNKLVIETLNYQRSIPSYIHIFSRVPQLKVLERADLFVTHGGLGSIKESIFMVCLCSCTRWIYTMIKTVTG